MNRFGESDGDEKEMARKAMAAIKDCVNVLEMDVALRKIGMNPCDRILFIMTVASRQVGFSEDMVKKWVPDITTQIQQKVDDKDEEVPSMCFAVGMYLGMAISSKCAIEDSGVRSKLMKSWFGGKIDLN